MDIFFVGSLIATVLVMIGTLIDERAQDASAPPTRPAAAPQPKPAREFEEDLPYDEAA